MPLSSDESFDNKKGLVTSVKISCSNSASGNCALNVVSFIGTRTAGYGMGSLEEWFACI